jgi:acyl-ACP thioesterase
MLPPGDIAKLIPDNRDLTVPMNLPATVGNLQGEEFVSDYTPVYTDLDVNGHVNNTRYADWLCNSLGIEEMTRSEPETVIFNYNHEILPGQNVLLRRTMKDTRYTLSGSIDGVTAFEIGGLLRRL